MPERAEPHARQEDVALDVRSPPRSDLARDAFNRGDVDASKQVHNTKLVEEARRMHGAQEKHGSEGSAYVRSLVLGGLDGVVTTFAVVAAAAGGNLSNRVLLLMGFANLVADGMSMGLGDFLSTKAERDYAMRELDRETWEYENYPAGEIDEMIELYERRGLTKEDATTIVTTMAKYKEQFIDMMVVEELGLLPADSGTSPAMNGAVTFGAFVVLGAIPLVAQLCMTQTNASAAARFAVTCVVTLLALAALGAAKARCTGENVARSAAFMVLNGGLSAAAAFFIGLGIGQLG